MEERRKSKVIDSRKYKELNDVIKSKCKEAKEDYWNEQCEELEKNSSTAHTKVKNLLSQQSCTSVGCIRAKKGEILMSREDIFTRSEYIEELFSIILVKDR